MNIEQMRVRVTEVYPANKGWATKVRLMKDAQVVAIFRRFQSKGLIK